MSKIKHWDEQTQQWVIDGASNAANIELSNPGYVDENGESISVDLGFTKISNRIFQAEKNIAWIYQNGAKGGGGGGGGGGTIDSTSYTIDIEEGNRVYTSGTSVTIHITINGGSVRKNFNVVIQDENGSTKGTYVITSLTRSEIKINGLTLSTNRLTINANSGQNYASPVTFTVIAGAISLSWSTMPATVIFPENIVGQVIINTSNSTDSDLMIVAECNGEEVPLSDTEKNIPKAKTSLVRLLSIENYIELHKVNIGESYDFTIYAMGVLNDNILQSNVLTFKCTITAPGTLYIITYNVDKTVPTNNIDLAKLNKFVYGNSIKFDYYLAFSKNEYSTYNIYYTITPCYFEEGILIENLSKLITGSLRDKVSKGVINLFVFNTASLPDDSIYDSDNNIYNFVKVNITAVSTEKDDINASRDLYFTLSTATTKYITATNFNNSLFAYYSPVMGIPTGNITEWIYDNKNTRFPYSNYGTVLLRYISMAGHNLSGFMHQNDTQGVHLLGKSWVDIEIPLFSTNQNELNLLDGSGWTLSFTFRTDSNVYESNVVACIGKYNSEQNLVAGIEIRANKVMYAVQSTLYSVNITKGDLTTVDIIGQRYVGLGDSQTNPTHWFIKTYINGVLSMITSHTSDLMFNVENGGIYGWYFNDYLHIGGRVINGEIYDACAVHLFDFKGYTTALSDNEIIQNSISATIYSQLESDSLPDMSKQNEMLQNNFILIGTDGNYHSMLFDDNDETVYKDAGSLLRDLVTALAESRIPYPIVVINQINLDPDFLGVTESLFDENLKKTVMAMLFPVTMDYYTMGNASPVRISNPNGMYISIQGTSSLRYNSKNYELYMGKMDDGLTDFLVLMKEDWLPENRYTIKSDVMDSSHVNNVLIGSIVNGLVTKEDSQGNITKIVPLDNTPPMERGDYQYANKVKHTSEGYPCILFINFKNESDAYNCRCMGIYNFNLGRYAYYNLGLKLIKNIVYESLDEVYPRVVSSYTEETEIEAGSPVYSMEVQENNAIAAFDLDDPDILNEGVFEFPYESSGEGSGRAPLLTLLSFLASFGTNIETDKKVYINGDWKTPKLKKVGSTWLAVDEYYSSYDPRNYVLSTLSDYMNWNNMVSYYMIVIIFGLVDSMIKNLTLRSWTRSSKSSIWYMCFYDMDTALRVDNTGAETVPYNAHIHRYYTDNSRTALAVVLNHCSSIPGVFNQAYGAGYNTRLLEIVENIIPDSADAKTLQSVYRDLRVNLFPDPEAFIDKYYIGQLNKVGPALYNYDYYLKYLLVKKIFIPSTHTYEDNTYNYSEISYLHGNGSASVKDWFVKRIKFLDGVYGVDGEGRNNLDVDNTPLKGLWNENNATAITNVSPTSISLGLTAESLIRMVISTSNRPFSFWIDEKYNQYRINNVSGALAITFYANDYLTALDNFNLFTWKNLQSLNFPLIRELSLRDLTNILASGFLSNNTTNLQSLMKLDLHGVTLLDSNSSIVYTPLTIALTLPNLEELDVSNSSFNEIPLSSSSVLKKLDLSYTKIKSLSYSDLAMLEDLIITGCNELESITLRNCPKIKSLVIPASVRTVEISNCPGIQSIEANYYGTQNTISNLQSFSVSACPGLKYVSFNNLNNPLLHIFLSGAYNLENIQLSKLVTTDITFPAKSSWNTLKEINLSNNNIKYINYDGLLTPVDYIDLEHFEDLERLTVSENKVIEGILCPNIEDKPIALVTNSISGCSNLKYLHGNFLIKGTRVFSNCTNLTLNLPSIYLPGIILYPVPFINSREGCNITFDESLTSTDEMFASCVQLSGNDFLMLMLKLHDNITSLNKMFMNCKGIDALIKYDLFRHCPNVTNITSFAESTSITGGIYSRSDNYNASDSTTFGTFDFLPYLLQASSAFSGTSLQYIDTNVFAPINGTYSRLKEADYMFSNCYDLESCLIVNLGNIVPNGMLKSKTFFTNLRNLDTFPKGFFSGCRKINMKIETETLPNEVKFDYLFHWFNDVNIGTIDSSIYMGINLVGEIHDNVFGGIVDSIDNTWYIARFTVIDSPFKDSGDLITCDLSRMSRMFQNLGTKLLQARYVFQGVRFTNSTIPNDIFSGCTKLNSIKGFFSNNTLTNEGQVYTFPDPLLFNDCTSLKNISYLFLDAYNLSIKLVGNGFINCALTDVSKMLINSGVFGQIPYRLFYMERDGVILQTIEDISEVFMGCYKLGYTNDRRINVGTPYIENKNEYYTKWSDGVIDIPGTRVPFLLDFTNFDGNDPYYIDGRDWASINPQLQNSPYYDELNDEVFTYDRLQAEAIEMLDFAEPGYQNYMFPADYLRYCSATNKLSSAFVGLSYTTKVIQTNDEGTNYLVPGVRDGLVGRLPCKLFEPLVSSTQFVLTFLNLDFCAFINFNSKAFILLGGYIYNPLYRGIKYPPDLLKHNTLLTSISGLFQGTFIEPGVDINPDLLENNTRLVDASSLFKDVLFNKSNFKDAGLGENPLIDFEMFNTCGYLTDVSRLFEVSNSRDYEKGLQVISSTLFDPVPGEEVKNPRIGNVSSMFANNSLLHGNIPLFDSAIFHMILLHNGYVEGVNKASISNALTFIDMHLAEQGWVPSSWTNNNG